MVLSCAGPFSFYGENVVKACVEAGTDYVDITGETPWVNYMAKKYGEEAKKKGVYLLSQSAFDSVPSDITIAIGALALMNKGEKVGRAENHFFLEGGAMPVGTLNTMLEMSLDARRKLLSALTFGMVKSETAEHKKEAAELKKLKDVEGLVPKQIKAAIKSDLMKNNTTLYSSMTGKCFLPFFMAPANVPIVHTTAEKLGYGVSKGDGFTYGEYFLSSDAGNFTVFAIAVAAVILAPIMNRPPLPAWGMLFITFYLFPFGLVLLALIFGGTLAICLGLPLWLFFPGLVSYVAKLINNSDPMSMKKKTFEKICNGFKESGISNCESTVRSASGDMTVKVTMKSNYDAGLGFTGLCSATVAASVVERRRKGLVGNGFSTAVAAIGPKELSTNLEKVKCEFTIEV